MTSQAIDIFDNHLGRGQSRFIQLSQNKLAKSILRYGFILVIFAYLTSKLSAIGWTNILQSLPSSPLFYVLSIAFVSLPVIAETLAFRLAAATETSPSLKTFIRKHVINKAVMNYAGEGYFVLQVSQLKGLNLSRAAIIIKDLNLARTFVANFWILFLILATVIFGNSSLLQKMIDISPVLAGLVGLLSLGVCLSGLVFFKKLTRLEFRIASKIAAIYFFRSCLAGCILIAQWSLILPGTALSVWALFLIVYFITKKSPVAGDLVFVSVAIALPGLGGDSAAVAAMLLTMTISLQVIYSLGFMLTTEIPKSEETRNIVPA